MKNTTKPLDSWCFFRCCCLLCSCLDSHDMKMNSICWIFRLLTLHLHLLGDLVDIILRAPVREHHQHFRNAPPYARVLGKDGLLHMLNGSTWIKSHKRFMFKDVTASCQEQDLHHFTDSGTPTSDGFYRNLHPDECDLRSPERHILLKLHANTCRELEWWSMRWKNKTFDNKYWKCLDLKKFYWNVVVVMSGLWYFSFCTCCSKCLCLFKV